MKWRQDTSGRFLCRPYYEQQELDSRAEQLMAEHLMRLYGQVLTPAPTGAIIKLIERDADDLDSYADLTVDGEGVEGVTYFFRDRKPRVRITRELSEQRHRARRLRMTLAHEYGHVWLHSELWRKTTEAAAVHRCQREQIEAGRAVDWMESQAGYAGGALLMPESRLRLVVRACCGEDQPTTDSEPATSLLQRVSEAFDVSEEAARVRLSQLGCLRGAPE
jgi:hypothetical protein